MLAKWQRRALEIICDFSRSLHLSNLVLNFQTLEDMSEQWN